MKALNLALMVLAMFMVATVGGCRKHHWSHDVTTVTVDNTIHTPGGLTVVDIQDPKGLLNTPNGPTQDQLLADLDYQVLTVWYNAELNEPNHPDFTSQGLLNYALKARFHLIVDCRFEDSERHVRFAQINDDIFLATEYKDKAGRRCAVAEAAMDLYTDDPGEDATAVNQ